MVRSEAQALLACCMEDGYKDDGKPATTKGYKYKVHVLVNKNRSIESNAALYDGNNNVLLEFRVRAWAFFDASKYNMARTIPMMWA